MKIISEQRCSEMIAEELSKYPEAKKMPVYSIWKRLQRYFVMMTIMLSSILAVTTFRQNKAVLLDWFGVEDFTVKESLITTLAGFLAIMISMLVYLVIHESIHFLAGYKYRNSSYIVAGKGTVSVLYSFFSCCFAEYGKHFAVLLDYADKLCIVHF